MLSKLFDKITALSLRFRWITVAIAMIILAAGVYSVTQLNQELLPRVEFPQSVIVVQWGDAASAEQFLEEVTIPLEEKLQGVEGVLNVESTTNPTFAFLIARYDFGLNQERILEAINEAIADAGLPETAESQVINFSFSDLPVVIASVSSSELTLPELKALVESELKPSLEGLEPVSRVIVSGGQELPEETEPEVAEATAVPEPTATPEDPGRLPQIIVDGAASLGVEIGYAQDITVDLLRSLSDRPTAAEDVMTILTIFPTDLLVYVPADTLSYLPVEYMDTLDPALVAELDELAAEFGGVGQYTLAEATAILSGNEIAAEEPTVTPTPETETITETAVLPTFIPVDLPETWVAGAAQLGQVISTTADITPEFMQGLVQFAPDQLTELTPEMWRALDPAVTAVALPLVAADLDPLLLLQLQAIQAAANGELPPPADLPQSWQDMAAGFGLTLTSTLSLANLPPQTFGLMSGGMPPEMMAELTPEILLGLPAFILAQLPEGMTAVLDEGMTQTITNILIADARHTALLSEPTTGAASDDPGRLPDLLIQGMAQAGLQLEQAADITPDMMRLLGGFGPQGIQALQLLTPDNLRLLQPEVIALLPAEFVETLPADLRGELDTLAAAYGGVGALALAEAAAADPARLPEVIIAGAAQAGFTVENAQDIDPDMIRLFGGLGEQGLQVLALLTEDNLRLLQPEVIALLPVAFLDTLDADLRAELDTLAAEFGGAGALALAEAEEATTASAEVPALSGIWLEPGPNGEEPLFKTAYDLLNNSFMPSAAALLNVLPSTPNADMAPQMMADLTPEVIAYLAENEEGFIENLEPTILELMSPETLTFMLATYPRAFGADLTARLESIAEVANLARLPDLLIQGMARAGLELEYAQDISPEMIRLLAGAGPEAIQALALLTPDNLRLLQPEVIALLPADFLDTLDAGLRAELDTLAAEFGGAGALALAEAAEAAAASAEAPPLAGIWLEPGPNGEEPLFKTAFDLLNNTFMPGAAALLNVLPSSPNADMAPQMIADLTPEVIAYLAENEEGFIENLEPTILELMSPATLAFMLENYPDAFDADLAARLAGIAAGTVAVFVPEAAITRTDGDPSVLIQLFKGGDDNTVDTAHAIFDELAAFEQAHPGMKATLVFEQATFIEESIAGVTREGSLGAVFAILVILVFLSGHIGGRYRLSWRATLVIAVSIPLSIFSAFFLMQWIPVTIGEGMQNWANSSGNSVVTFISRLFPNSVTLNIMTLSGLTVAIGRVVDDSIVVLENSYRHIQRGEETNDAIRAATREVAIAIFSATVTTMVVFLPLGFVGGIIGSVFMPFGLTVVWALAASFMVSITVVPALTSLFINKNNIPEERETSMQRWYTPMLEWALTHRALTLLGSVVIFAGSLYLLTLLPQSFIPALGEPTINVSIELPNGTSILETNEAVAQFEEAINDIAGLGSVQTTVGSAAGFEALFSQGSVTQNIASLTISVENKDELDALTKAVRAKAVGQFGEENATVSAASQTGFSGFSLTVTGDSLEDLLPVVADVKAAIGSVDLEGDGVPDIANVTSTVDDLIAGNGNGSTVYIRIDGRPAISFSGELETQNTLGVTNAAKAAIQAVDSLPAGAVVSEGFESQQQVQGFQSMLLAIAISIVLVYIVMGLTFRSFILPFVILFSLPFALVGAAIALYVTSSVMGISALIGFMMLVGIVTTNGIVLMELVQQLRARGMGTYEALVTGGRTRLRPIWMTALTAILALIPLAASAEAGAIIASDLARAVMGGLLVSTALTLIVVPVVFYLFQDLTDWIGKKLGRG